MRDELLRPPRLDGDLPLFLPLFPLFLLLGGLLLFPSAGSGATSCFSESCGISCSPDAPVGISELVPSSEFPEGATTPIAMVDPADGRGRFLIATQEGVILVWDRGSETILPGFFLDLRDDVGGPVVASGERGLLALALDPDYAATGRLYVFYTSVDVAGPVSFGDVVVARYERSAGNPDAADAGSATTILAIEHSSASNHNGGWLAFGPDLFLYVSTGDGGGGCDSQQGAAGDAQSTDSLAGKLLRIDVHGVDPEAGLPDDCGVTSGQYGIPSQNPFAGQEPACDEVWALGLRNPFRFSFDRDTGDLWVGDVGQSKWEEINLQAASTPAPVDFGWVCREGCEAANNEESNCAVGGCPLDIGITCEFPRTTGGSWDPVLCHYNGGWKAIIGGYRYRGSRVPSIAGDYLYGDAACGQIWKTTALDPASPAAIDAACWSSGHGGLYAFAEDQHGELYLINGAAGRIDCIHDGDGCFWAATAVFADGFETGDASRWSFQSSGG